MLETSAGVLVDVVAGHVAVVVPTVFVAGIVLGDSDCVFAAFVESLRNCTGTSGYNLLNIW